MFSFAIIQNVDGVNILTPSIRMLFLPYSADR